MKKKHLNHPTEMYVRNTHNILQLDQTTGEAITAIRNIHSEKDKPYYFVLDQKGHLIGFVNIRQLLIQDPKTPLKDIVKTKVHLVQHRQSMLDALAIMQKFHLLAIPVLKQGLFLGVIDLQEYFEEDLQIDSKRKRLQIFQMIGVIVEEGPTKSLYKKYIHRMPWVFCNIVGGLMCAIISDIYEVVLQNVILLAMFIPLVLSLSESISMQSMTMSIYLMTHKKHSWSKIFYYTILESRLYFLISITASVIVGLLSLFWGEGFAPAWVICMSIFISVNCTAVLGSLIPVVLHRWRLDPKVASGPIVLMVGDVFTTFIYLGLGFIFLL
jgi:magnesium transporter